MKGSNWIPAHVLPEVGSQRAYADNLLKASAEAGFNMLRVWGGGVYESEHFYQVRWWVCNRLCTDAERVANSCATSWASWCGRTFCSRAACTRWTRPTWTACAPRSCRPSGGCSTTPASHSGPETTRMRPRSLEIGKQHQNMVSTKISFLL